MKFQYLQLVMGKHDRVYLDVLEINLVFYILDSLSRFLLIKERCVNIIYNVNIHIYWYLPYILIKVIYY